MVDPVTLQMVRDVVAIFGVIAGFTYYVMTVRNSQRMQKMQLDTRQAELYMRLWEKRNTKEFSEIRFDVWSMRNTGLDDFVDRSRMGKSYKGCKEIAIIKGGIL